jgi:ribonuclease Z
VLRHNVVALLLLVSAALGGCDRIRSAIYDRAAERQAAGDNTEWLRDGALHVFLCGTGTPLPDPDRAGPCTAVIAGGKLFLFDVGPGSWERIQLFRLPRAALGGVLLTHFHSDHIGDLGETITQSWIAGRATPLRVYGPPGIDSVVAGFQQAYGLDGNYRVAHHGEEAMPRAGSTAIAQQVPVPVAGKDQLVLEQDGVRITAFSVDHRPVTPAFGYRVDYNGRSVVISGDTAKAENLARHAKGADIVVHEALAAHIVEQIGPRLAALGQERLAKLARDVIDYHATPVDAAEVARDAEARMLVLTHMVPPPSNALFGRMFLQGVGDVWDGPVVLGADGMHFTLPQGSTEIEQSTLD